MLPKEVEAAFNTQYDDIHVPVFFDKLASHGIAPEDDEDMRILLQMGSDLFARHQAFQEKQAGAPNRKSIIKEAARDLGIAMNQFDREHGLQKSGEDRAVAQYAHQLAQNPKLVKAASVWLGFQARAAQQ